MTLKKKYTAILVDDEIGNVENLEILLNEFCIHIDIVKKETTLKNAKKSIVNLQPDILFLDIQMGSQTIFSLLEGFDVISAEIIFVTAYDNYAIEALKYGSVGYLLKPVNIDKLQQAVSKAIHTIDSKKSKRIEGGRSRNLAISMGKIAFPTQRGFQLEYIDNIQYMIAQGSYCEIYFDNQKSLLVSKNLKYYETKLKMHSFIRTHASALINFRYIIELNRSDGGYIVMEDGKHLPVSRQKRLELECLIRECG